MLHFFWNPYLMSTGSGGETDCIPSLNSQKEDNTSVCSSWMD